MTVKADPQSKKIRFKCLGGKGYHSGYTGVIKCLNGFKARARMIRSKYNDW